MDLDALINKHYGIQLSSAELLEEQLEILVDEVMGGFTGIIKEEKGGTSKIKQSETEVVLTLAMIPEIPISEIGWANTTTRDGEEVKPAQREQLEAFLSNVTPSGTFTEKLKDLEGFYGSGGEGGLEVFSKINSNPDLSGRIATVMSYLVFYKTLTTIITNFNASSAGFSFEAFLATLLGGSQIPANTGTIADFTTAEGIPVSLKLYNEKTVVVGGSYTDLINDLVNPQFSSDFMRYVVCMKDLSGEGMDLNGSIGFYQFDFTLDNIVNILSKSKKGHSQSSVKIPIKYAQEAKSGNHLFNIGDTLPALGKLPSIEEMEKDFEDTLRLSIASAIENNLLPDITSNIDKYLIKLDFSNNDSIFLGQHLRGKSNLSKREIENTILALDIIPSDPETDLRPTKSNEFVIILKDLTIAANNSVISKNSRDEKTRMRKAAIEETEFLSIEDSVEFYENLKKPEHKKAALKNTLGYISTLQFDLNRGNVLDISQLAGQHRVLPKENGGTPKIGNIKIGTDAVEKMLNNCREILNGSVLSIFSNLKDLTTNIQGYFAGGLSDDKQAGEAQSSARTIDTETEKVKTGN